MPIIHHKGQLAFFAHVPKTGGISVETFLRTHCDGLSLIDDEWTLHDCVDGIFATSPQHIKAADLEKILPTDIYTYMFAVVRNPIDRVISEYGFHEESRELLGSLGFSIWLETSLTAARRYPNVSDNHLRPQSDLVPEGAEVFKLEDGMEQALSVVAERLELGIEVETVPHKNSSAHRDSVSLTRQDVEAIIDVYSVDFERFGYPLPDLSSLPQRKFNWLKKLLGGILGRLRALHHLIRSPIPNFLRSFVKSIHGLFRPRHAKGTKND